MRIPPPDADPPPPPPAPAQVEFEPSPSIGVGLAHLLGYLNLGYLGALPAIATFAAVALYGCPVPMVVFFGGLIGVVTWMAIVYGYTEVPDSPWVALMVLVDGPVLALLSMPGGRALGGFAMQAYLVDGVALWLAIACLAATNEKIDSTQKRGTFALVVIALSTMLALFWPYIRHDLAGHWGDLVMLVVGIVWSAVVHKRVLFSRYMVRDTFGPQVLPFMVGFPFLWMFALFAGIGWHFHA